MTRPSSTCPSSHSYYPVQWSLKYFHMIPKSVQWWLRASPTQRMTSFSNGIIQIHSSSIRILSYRNLTSYETRRRTARWSIPLALSPAFLSFSIWRGDLDITCFTLTFQRDWSSLCEALCSFEGLNRNRGIHVGWTLFFQVLDIILDQTGSNSCESNAWSDFSTNSGNSEYTVTVVPSSGFIREGYWRLDVLLHSLCFHVSHGICCRESLPGKWNPYNQRIWRRLHCNGTSETPGNAHVKLLGHNHVNLPQFIPHRLLPHLRRATTAKSTTE